MGRIKDLSKRKKKDFDFNAFARRFGAQPTTDKSVPCQSTLQSTRRNTHRVQKRKKVSGKLPRKANTVQKTGADGNDIVAEPESSSPLSSTVTIQLGDQSAHIQ